MANVKISELTALTAPAAADVIAIVDTSATETKKITACCFVTQAFEDFTVGDDLCFSSAGAVINFNSADVTITHASNSLTFDGGSVIFNEAGGAFDVRMEGDTEANLFIADASADRIGIGTATPATLLHVQGAFTGTGVLSIDDTTDTSSTTTGSIHTDGGVGLAKALWVGTTSCFVGATTHASTLTVGVDDTGHDVKFFGASAGAFMLYDESADTLDVRGATAAGPGVLKLTTGELTNVDGGILGRLEFQAPLDSAGTDAILVAASIWAEADATFSASVNTTDLVFATAASETAAEKMRITSAGNVGIGTTAPGEVLDVTTATNETGIIVENTNQSPTFTMETTHSNADARNWDFITNKSSYGDWQLRVGASSGAAPGTIVMSALKSGNVGIGTNAPSNLLHLEDNSSNAVMFIDQNGAGDLLVLKCGATERFRLTATGKLGIGTATPAVELDVEGDIAIGNQDKLYFDGGVHTFICETSGSTLIFAVADTAVMCLNDGFHMVVNSCLKVGIAATGADASFNAECSGKQVCWDASYQSGVGGFVIVDTTRLVFGSGCDAEMYYDGSTLTLNPRVVGTGNFSVGGGATCFLVYGATSKTGLGTSAPDSKVHIYTGAGGAAADSAADELNIEGSSSTVGMTISGPASNEGNIFFADDSNSAVGRITYAHAANCFYFTTNSVKALYIDSAQNVGFGAPAFSTQSAWVSMNYGFNATIVAQCALGVGNGFWLVQNARRDAASCWAHINADEASAVAQSDGNITFQTAVCAAADATAAFTVKMTVNNDGCVCVNCGLDVGGEMTAGTKTFRIDHPLEYKKDTHQLVHSVVEGPQAEVMYRGIVQLIDGSAEINVDTVSGMTEGTFVALSRCTQVFTTNESNWDAVKGNVTGNTLTIESNAEASTACISWMVVGERCDQAMMTADWTTEGGRPILEPEK